MKQVFIGMLLLFFSAGAFAQEITYVEVEGAEVDGPLLSKRGKPILPEAGDYSFSVDASPFFAYLSGLFTDNGFSAPQPGYVNPPNIGWGNTITGRYFVSEDMAYRGRLRIGYRSNMAEFHVPYGNAGENNEYINEQKSSATAIQLGGGVEWRKGDGQIQGYYGGELLVGFSSAKTTFDYEEPIDSAGVFSRPLEINNGSSFQVGPRAFAGVQYFFAPKMALGLEYGWHILYTSMGATTRTFEQLDPATGEITEDESVITGKISRFDMDTDLNNFNITLAFFF